MTASAEAPLNVGITIPRDQGPVDANRLRGLLARAADAGVDHIFTADHVSFHGGSGMDGVTYLAYVGGMEPRLNLYLGVYLLALRHPMVAARQIASLAELAPGRVTIGVGVGGEDRHEFEVCEIDPATRGRRTNVAMSLVRKLLDGDTVQGDGEFFDFRDGRILPTPSPAVPITVGGRSPAALERAGRLGDGWLAVWSSAPRFAEGVDVVESHNPDRTAPWQHGVQVWVGVGEDPADGRTHIAHQMRNFYKMDFERFERYCPTGPPELIADFLRPFVDAGASTLNIKPCGPNPEAEIDAVAEVRRLLLS